MRKGDVRRGLRASRRRKSSSIMGVNFVILYLFAFWNVYMDVYVLYDDV